MTKKQKNEIVTKMLEWAKKEYREFNGIRVVPLNGYYRFMVYAVDVFITCASISVLD